MTLQDAVEKYGADATRVALADAGDGTEDANLEETVANSIILRLFTYIHKLLVNSSTRAAQKKSLSLFLSYMYVHM